MKKINVKDRDDERNNGHGYSDPTAYEAIKHVDRDEARFKKLLKTIFSISELAGFQIEGRIKLRDLRTGKLWE